MEEDGRSTEENERKGDGRGKLNVKGRRGGQGGYTGSFLVIKPTDCCCCCGVRNISAVSNTYCVSLDKETNSSA